jgi:hypothetical protein
MDLLRRFIPLSLLATCIFAAVYISEQQMLRTEANDPQIQLAEDTAARLSTKEDTVEVTSLPRVDISHSLSPFVIVYDANGKVIAASGELNGKIPQLPSGVLAFTKEHDDDRLTWQPQAGVRIAAVVKHFSGRTTGYVLAGRSLREVEKRENTLQLQLFCGYIFTLVVILIGVMITPLPTRKKSK